MRAIIFIMAAIGALAALPAGATTCFDVKPAVINKITAGVMSSCKSSVDKGRVRDTVASVVQEENLFLPCASQCGDKAGCPEQFANEVSGSALKTMRNNGSVSAMCKRFSR